MIVVVDEQIFDPRKHKIMLVLSEKDKHSIETMDKGLNSYAAFPDTSNREKIIEWMKAKLKQINNEFELEKHGKKK